MTQPGAGRGLTPGVCGDHRILTTVAPRSQPPRPPGRTPDDRRPGPDPSARHVTPPAWPDSALPIRSRRSVCRVRRGVPPGPRRSGVGGRTGRAAAIRPQDRGGPEFGCWLWAGSCNREGASGYRTVAYQEKTELVHHVGFQLLVGEIPEGFQVSHAVPRGFHHARCCNPHHPEAVTREEALRRRDRGRSRSRRIHCRHDHVYAPENTYLDPEGSGSAGPVVARGPRALRLGPAM